MARHLFLIDWSCCLGAGGEGEVFLGRSVKTWELFAIKVSTSLDRESAREQLAAELERCNRAACAGAVGLVAWNLEAERPFLVFELARAGSLADEMKELKDQGRVYHPVRALQRIREVLLALGHVHTRGLVHRDVKPANLLRFDQGIKIADFGTGRSLLPLQALDTEAFVGTRLYASPEQTRGERVDRRSDLYAVGCILFEMLTGSLPTPGRTDSLGGYPNLLIIPELDTLVRALLHADQAQRPSNCADAIAMLDQTLNSYARARRVWKELGLGPSPY
jgi:serine/threonine-protein kinase